MTGTMTYIGYTARIEYDDEDEILYGQLTGISDVVGFHAESVRALRAAFEQAVDDYIDACAKAGKAPQKPYSECVTFRINPETYRWMAVAAEVAGVSLSVWADDVLSAAAGKS